MASWDDLYTTAAAQAGCFTTAQARAAGYSTHLLHHHRRRGRVRRLRRGIYRLVHFPADADEDLVVLWLWSDRQGVFSHRTALAAHRLGDGLPAHHDLTLPLAARLRRLRPPKAVRLHFADLAEDERSWHGPVPITSPSRTLADCVEAEAPPDLIEAALRDGLRRNLFEATTVREAERHLRAFEQESRGPRDYASPAAFRMALEERLRTTARHDGTPVARLRQLLVFDRFLARVFALLGGEVVLKGGLALELRAQRPRTTRDVDLRVRGSATSLLERLPQAGRMALGDHLTFAIAPDAAHPRLTADGLPYGGRRFRARATLADRPFGDPFAVDVTLGEPLVGDVEEVTAPDWLGFAGVSPPRLRLLSLESHIAEKLHAFTLPRARANTRMKDLPDLALLATVRTVLARDLRAGIAATFAARGTHAVPTAVPDPPAVWARRYRQLAVDDGLPWPDLDSVLQAVRAFLDPVLAGGGGRWDPGASQWGALTAS